MVSITTVLEPTALNLLSYWDKLKLCVTTCQVLLTETHLDTPNKLSVWYVTRMHQPELCYTGEQVHMCIWICPKPRVGPKAFFFYTVTRPYILDT